jgi:hypothetical protein
MSKFTHMRLSIPPRRKCPQNLPERESGVKQRRNELVSEKKTAIAGNINMPYHP